MAGGARSPDSGVSLLCMRCTMRPSICSGGHAAHELVGVGEQVAFGARPRCPGLQEAGSVADAHRRRRPGPAARPPACRASSATVRPRGGGRDAGARGRFEQGEHVECGGAAGELVLAGLEGAHARRARGQHDEPDPAADGAGARSRRDADRALVGRDLDDAGRGAWIGRGSGWTSLGTERRGRPGLTTTPRSSPAARRPAQPRRGERSRTAGQL